MTQGQGGKKHCSVFCLSIVLIDYGAAFCESRYISLNCECGNWSICYFHTILRGRSKTGILEIDGQKSSKIQPIFCKNFLPILAIIRHKYFASIFSQRRSSFRDELLFISFSSYHLP